MTDTDCAFGQAYVPTRSERFWRALGFRSAYQERPEETAEFPSYMVTDIRINVSLLDRLRILLSGKIHIESVHATDVAVHHAKTQTAVGVERP